MSNVSRSEDMLVVPMTPEKQGPDWLALIRRFYFYLIATVSLLVGLNALFGLLEMLILVWLEPKPALGTAGFIRNMAARNGSQLLVAAPIFLIHWAAILRRRQEPLEARSGIRKFFLYLMAGFALGYGATSLGDLVDQATQVLLGLPPRELVDWPARWIYLALRMAISGGLLAYLLGQLHEDGDWGEELGWAGSWRRLFQTLVGLVGLGLLLGGGSAILDGLAKFALHRVAGDPTFALPRSQMATGVSMLVVGGLFWRVNWRAWLGIVQTHPPEARTALRRVYLYASVLLSAASTLFAAAVALQELLLLFFGVEQPGIPFWDGLLEPLVFLPLGLAAWIWHRPRVHEETARYGESPESIGVRRIYYYLVAATGLVLTWYGLVTVVRILLDPWVAGTALSTGGFQARQLANGLSLLAVGAPVWAIHWQRVQQVARRPDLTGQEERSSAPRRAYLYAVALVGALIILFDLATVLYRLFLWLLGEPGAELFQVRTVDALARSGISLVIWLFHVLALRRDGQLGAEEAVEGKARPAAASPEEVARRRGELEARIRRLEAELAAARAELEKLEE